MRIKSDRWPPFFGGANQLWQKIKPFCQNDPSVTTQWHTISRPVRWFYSQPRGGEIGFTEILPSNNPALELDVVYGYPPLGNINVRFCIPNVRILERICHFPTQGLSKWLYHTAKCASFLGWPNFHNIAWPQHFPREEVMQRFVLHRTADLLGALSLLCQDNGFFAGKVISHHSGHEVDLRAVRMAHALLKPLAP